MTRTILLTAAVAAALTAAVAPTNASAAEPAAKDGQISADMLAQFGLGGSEAVSDEEGEDIRGKGGRVQYRVIISKLVNNKIRQVKRIVTRKALTRLIRLNSGKYTVKYKAVTPRTKTTVSRSSGFRPATNFSGLR